MWAACVRMAAMPSPTQRTLDFWVPGIPAPGGSKRGFPHAKTGKVVMVDMGGERTKNWRESVKVAAMQSGQYLEGPLALRVVFNMPRPKCHYRTGRYAGELKPNAPTHHTKSPDATKLLRSTEDALTGVVWGDDAQIVEQEVSKQWATGQPGARITIMELT